MGDEVVVQLCVVILDTDPSPEAGFVLQYPIAGHDHGKVSNVHPDPASSESLVALYEISLDRCTCTAQVNPTPVSARIALE